MLREDFRLDSDVDVLVEFEPGSSVGYLGLAAMEAEPVAPDGSTCIDVARQALAKKAPEWI